MKLAPWGTGTLGLNSTRDYLGIDPPNFRHQLSDAPLGLFQGLLHMCQTILPALWRYIGHIPRHAPSIFLFDS